MFEFISGNFATIVIGIVVFGILAAVVFKMIKDRKNHRSCCGCSCENCRSTGNCHRD